MKQRYFRRKKGNNRMFTITFIVVNSTRKWLFKLELFPCSAVEDVFYIEEHLFFSFFFFCSPSSLTEKLERWQRLSTFHTTTNHHYHLSPGALNSAMMSSIYLLLVFHGHKALNLTDQLLICLLHVVDFLFM